MKTLSTNAGLSKEYRNHSIRATVITNLDEKGFEACHVMATSGHKSEVSINNYSMKCPSNKRKQIFEALAENLVENDSRSEAKKTKCEPLDTVPVPQQNEPNLLNYTQSTRMIYQTFSKWMKT